MFAQVSVIQSEAELPPEVTAGLLILCFFYLVLVLMFCAMCRNMAQRKGYGGWFGIVLGLFLGLLGAILIACLPDQNRRRRKRLQAATQSRMQVAATELPQQYDSPFPAQFPARPQLPAPAWPPQSLTPATQYPQPERACPTCRGSGTIT